MTAKVQRMSLVEKIAKIFFATHIPITLLVDLSPLYPRKGIFQLTHWIRNRYIEQFHDPLVAGVSSPGGWFKSLLSLEGLIQLPICFFVCLQYYRGHQRKTSTRFTIILYSVQVWTATWACIFEVLSFSNTVVSTAQKLCLLGFYAPYLIIPFLMAWSNTTSLLLDNRRLSQELRYLRKICSNSHVKQLNVIKKTIMITGANSGIGFGIVQQLIHQNRIPLERMELQLKFILTVRDKAKAEVVKQSLKQDLDMYQDSVRIDFIYLDLLSMKSVEAASSSICQILQEEVLSSVICNAGMAQYLRIDLKKALKQALFHPIQAISQPKYLVQTTGGKSTDDLGATFQANVFGHYYLVERLQELKKILPQQTSLIWMSSLEAAGNVLKDGDIQALSHPLGYESSKRVMDLLWHTTAKKKDDLTVFCVHPGFATTNIAAAMLPAWLGPLWIWTFHVVRTCGLKFHVATAFNGAYAPAVLAMYGEEYERNASSVKYGSAMSWDGRSYVADTSYDAIDEVQAFQVAEEVQNLYLSWRRRLC